jgi:hypothetical protein
MDYEKRVKELEEKLAIYEADASAKFYSALVHAVEHIQQKLTDKSLNLEEDTFAKSVITLADKSGKIFEGLKLGKESFMKTEDNDKDKKKKMSKLGDQVGI